MKNNIIIAATIALSTLIPAITNAQSYQVKCNAPQTYCEFDWYGRYNCWTQQYCCQQYCNAWGTNCYFGACWWQ